VRNIIRFTDLSPHNMQLSAIICTHNPRPDHLRRTLEGLQRQTLDRAQWELLLIDNHSNEILRDVWDLGWHVNGRHVREDRLGLTPARLRGIAETSADLVLFIDDDNVLDPTYLEVVLQLAAEFPKLGCFGAGIIRPEFEEPPPPEFTPYLPMLALRDEQRALWSNLPDDHVVPCGAGMVVRRTVAEAYERKIRTSSSMALLDRKGNQLNSGGDDEVSWVACEEGYIKGMFPDLRIVHLIGKERTTKEYLLRLREGIGFSNALLRHLHGRSVKRPDRPYRMRPAQLANDLVRGRFYDFFKNGKRYMEQRSLSALDQEFAEAWSKGVERFMDPQ